MWGDGVEFNKIRRMYIAVFVTIILTVILWPHVRVQANSVNAPPLEGISFYIVAAIIGGIIIATLTYVSWKKYKAEQKRKRKDENS